MNINAFAFTGTMLLTWILVVFVSCLVPFFSRKDTAFGVSVPESEYYKEFLTKLRYHYSVVLLICGIALGVGSLFTRISFDMNISVWILTTSILIYLAIVAVMYLKSYYKVRKYKQNSNWEITRTVSAALTVDKNEKKPINPLWFLSYLAITAGLIVVGIIRYPALPDQMPMHYNIAGQVDRYAPKSLGTIWEMPIMQIIIALVFFGTYYAILHAKSQSSGGNIEEGLKKGREFKVIMSKFIFFIGLAVMLIFGIAQLTILGLMSSSVTFAAPIALMAVVFVIVAYLITKVGQGGSRMGNSSGILSRTASDDDSNWIFGAIYYNKDDPSIFVEKRFGLGYTINVGNSIGKIIVTGIIVLIGILLILPFVFH